MNIESTKSIPPIENYDPLAKFLTKTLRLTPIKYSLLMLVANVIVDSWIGWYYDIFFTHTEIPGLLQDYTALTADFVMNTVIAGLYLWTTIGATRLFQQLYDSKIFKSDIEYKKVVDESRPFFYSRTVFFIVLGLSLFFTLAQITAYYGLLPWKTIGGYIDLYPSISFARAPFWFLIFYALFLGIYNVAVTIITLRKMFRTEDIQLLPLHPDRCGGLGSISQYTTKIAYAIGATGLMMSAATIYEIQNGTLQDAYPVILGIVGYIILAPLLFFWPLGTARSAMQEAKDEEILLLAQQFHKVYEQVKEDVSKEDISSQARDFQSSIENLENLKKLYQIALEFPVWPFDTRNLRRFFVIVTAPLVPALISITTEMLQRFILWLAS